MEGNFHIQSNGGSIRADNYSLTFYDRGTAKKEEGFEVYAHAYGKFVCIFMHSDGTARVMVSDGEPGGKTFLDEAVK